MQGKWTEKKQHPLFFLSDLVLVEKEEENRELSENFPVNHLPGTA